MAIPAGSTANAAPLPQALALRPATPSIDTATSTEPAAVDVFGPERSSAWAHLTSAANHVFVAGQLLHAHRAARMEAGGGNANLCTHTKLTAISKLCGGVVQHDGTVHARQEACHRAAQR